MNKKSDLKQSEKDIFLAAVKGTKQLVHTKITPKNISHLKKPRQSILENKTNPFQFHDAPDQQKVSSEDILEFHRGGLQHKVLRKLRRGQYNVEATLDMHGMHVVEAHEALSDFLLHCLKKDIRHVLIIHGKGHGPDKPILKNKVNQWLRQIESVLAFCSATAQEGRTGAIYVLLKGGDSIDR